MMSLRVRPGLLTLVLVLGLVALVAPATAHGSGFGDASVTDGEPTDGHSDHRATAEWSSRFAVGNGTVDTFRDVQVDNDGSGVAVGGSRSDEMGDIILAPFDGNGASSEATTIDLGGDDFATSVASDGDDGYVLTGYTTDTDRGGKDAALVWVDENGTVAAERTYGGSGDDYACWIARTEDGNYIVAAFSDSFGDGSMDGWIMEVTGEGDVVWNRTFEQPGADYLEFATVTEDHGYVFAGRRTTESGDMDGWVISTDRDGDVRWQADVGGNGTQKAWGAVESSDGLVVAGDSGAHTDGDPMLAALGPGGETRWIERYDGPFSSGHSVIPMDDGYLLAASRYGPSPNETGVRLIQTSSDGSLVGSTRVGDGLDWVWQLTAGPSNLYIAGPSKLSADENDRAWLAALDPGSLASEASEDPAAASTGDTSGSEEPSSERTMVGQQTDESESANGSTGGDAGEQMPGMGPIAAFVGLAAVTAAAAIRR